MWLHLGLSLGLGPPPFQEIILHFVHLWLCGALLAVHDYTMVCFSVEMCINLRPSLRLGLSLT